MRYIILALLLSGCASFKGVEMDDAERKACAEKGCHVYTLELLLKWAAGIYNKGFKAGKDSI